MKIAITGGAGFIGTVLAGQLIASGHDVVLLDLVKSTAYPEHSTICDVTDEEKLTQNLKGVDVVYHLAAEHRDDVRPIQKYYDVNVGSAKALVAAAKAHQINKIIFTSSVAVYGLNGGESTEESEPDPFNDYGRSKLEAEHVFDAWASEPGKSDRSLVTVRLVATFGPGNRGNVFTLINQIARGKFIMVGNGSNAKSLAYVYNAASFLTFCLSLGAGAHLFNYADKPDLNMNQMVRHIREALGFKGLGPRIPYFIGIAGGKTFDIAAQLTGRTFPISTVRVEKFCANTVVNADKARAAGFTAPHSLQKGLQAMINVDFLEKAAA